VVITNAFSIATMKLWLRSWFFRTPYIIWSGAIRLTDRNVSVFRRLQRRLVVSRAAAYIAYGTLAKQYLIELGAREDKVFIGINTVDTEFYRIEAAIHRDSERGGEATRKLLAVSYLTPRKRIESLLYVVRELATMRDDFQLLVLGDGPEMLRLRKLAHDIGVSSLVSFEGFVQVADIPGYMARSRIFLFPTDFDVWGLVLVEAMAAGMPCIASINAGATHDLVIDGVTGYAADFDSASRVAERVNWLFDHPEQAASIGAESARFIRAKASLAISSAGFVRAIQSVLSDGCG
jgi:glycosyltransferase involved in cell wall biosynthesis